MLACALLGGPVTTVQAGWLPSCARGPAASSGAQPGEPGACPSCSAPRPPACPVTCLPSSRAALQLQVRLGAHLLPPGAVFRRGPVRVSDAVLKAFVLKHIFPAFRAPY